MIEQMRRELEAVKAHAPTKVGNSYIVEPSQAIMKMRTQLEVKKGSADLFVEQLKRQMAS